MANALVEIEIDGALNESVLFLPLARKIRGRLDFERLNQEWALKVWDRWGRQPIPGQRLQLDTKTGAAKLVEPLREEGHETLGKRIAEETNSIIPEVILKEWI